MKPKLIAIEFDGENYVVWKMKPSAIRDEASGKYWTKPKAVFGKKARIAASAIDGLAK